MCKGHAQYSPFAPGSSKVASGCFGLVVSFVHTFAPTTHAHAVIFSPIWFLCILLLEERCAHV